MVSYYGKSFWIDVVDSQKFGDCRKTAFTIQDLMKSENIDVKVYEIWCENYSTRAIERLDDDGWCGNHYVVKIKSKFYDFGKGTNTINGTYLLSEKSDDEKYNPELSEFEKRLMDIKNPENIALRKIFKHR